MNPSIRYSLTVEDIIAFNSFQMTRLPSGRPLPPWAHVILWLCVVVIVACMTVFALSIKWTVGSFTAVASPATIIFVFVCYILLFRLRFPGIVRSRIRKTYSPGRNRAMFCEHSLEIDESGFTDTTDFSKVWYAWGAVERVESANGYTYLFTSAANAFIIPHQRVLEGDLPAFLEKIRTLCHLDHSPGSIASS